MKISDEKLEKLKEKIIERVKNGDYEKKNFTDFTQLIFNKVVINHIHKSPFTSLYILIDGYKIGDLNIGFLKNLLDIEDSIKLKNTNTVIDNFLKS